MIKKSMRQKARSLALQAIYQWHFNPISFTVLEEQLLPEVNPKKIDKEFFSDLVGGTLRYRKEIDEGMEPFLDRKISELNPIELAVMRLAIYELMYRLDVPYKVVINEALELAKKFGSTDGHKYVNGVLDKVAAKVRAVEVKG